MQVRTLSKVLRPLRWAPGTPRLRTVSPSERLPFNLWAKYIRSEATAR